MNEFFVNRVVKGSFIIPPNTSANSGSTLAYDTGVAIPKGAIVTGIKYLPGAITGAATLGALTINPSVGGQVIGTADVQASAALVNTVAANHVLSATAGVYITAGGNLAVGFASSASNRSLASIAPASIFVEYIYAN